MDYFLIDGHVNRRNIICLRSQFPPTYKNRVESENHKETGLFVSALSLFSNGIPNYFPSSSMFVSPSGIFFRFVYVPFTFRYNVML